MLDKTLAFLNERDLLGARGVVGVSGGPDSVALAHVLARLVEDGNLTGLTLAHVNHRLRGEESDADEAFVRQLPQTWKIASVTVRCQRVDVAAVAVAQALNLEDAARRVRYAFFAEVAREVGAVWVATAHTANDQAETVLLRLLRGTGIRGLAGIHRERPLEAGVRLVRPWLDVRRSDVEAYLAEEGLTVRTDASNQDPRFLRNRIRRDLMPLLERDYQPALVDLLCRLAEQSEEAQALLAVLAAELRERAEKPRAGAVIVLDAEALALAPPLVAREALRSIWQREGWPLDAMRRPDWQRLELLIRGLTPAIDFTGVRAVRKGGVLQLHPA